MCCYPFGPGWSWISAVQVAAPLSVPPARSGLCLLGRSGSHEKPRMLGTRGTFGSVRVPPC
eukprot:8739476-Alexandrium_andersonii.AAC.1